MNHAGGVCPGYPHAASMQPSSGVDEDKLAEAERDAALAAIERVRAIAECGAEEQADLLWASFQATTQASALERGGLTADGMAPVPAQGTLEDRLKALQPDAWQQEFCGGGGKAARGQAGAQPAAAAQQGARPPGSPSLLLVSPSALGAVNLIKLCPQFNKVGGAAGEG